EIGDHDILVLRNGKKSRIAFESYQLLIGRAFLCYDIVVGHDDDVARKAYSMLAEKAAMQTRAEAMKQSARRAMKNEKLVKILNKATKNLAGRKAALESGIESIEEAMTAGNVSDEDKQLLADGLEIAKKSIENLVGKPHIHIAGNRGR
ncbi:MAG: hypothetical protein LBB08_02595, partial [Rickettsiales bacterium]|nr:hypothetical protein [Rickettsiales bacterium]